MAYECSGSDPSVADIMGRIEEKKAEAAALEARIADARAQTQSLRERLSEAGVEDASLSPQGVVLKSGAAVNWQAEVEEERFRELHQLLQWLSATVDLTHPKTFECGAEGEALVGGRRVELQRMVAWTLAGSGSTGQKLSVPAEMEVEVGSLLAGARARGGSIEQAAVRRLAADWEVVSAEMAPAGEDRVEPAIFVIHRQTTRALVVARWPATEPPQLRHNGFDPAAYFAPLAAGADLAPSPPPPQLIQASKYFCPHAAAGPAPPPPRPVDPPAKPDPPARVRLEKIIVEVEKPEGGWLGIDVDFETEGDATIVVAGVYDSDSDCVITQWNNANPLRQIRPGNRIIAVNEVSGNASAMDDKLCLNGFMRLVVVRETPVPSESQAPTHSAEDPLVVSKGDRVEVEREGRWLSGVLVRVEGDTASVKCKEDPSGAVTIAPLTRVRVATDQLENDGETPRALKAPFRHFRARSLG